MDAFGHHALLEKLQELSPGEAAWATELGAREVLCAVGARHWRSHLLYKSLPIENNGPRKQNPFLLQYLCNISSSLY